MDRPDGYDLYLEEGMQAEEARYYEEIERGINMLNELELIELKYLSALGFKYIGRHEIGTVEVFKKMPVRDKVVNGSKHGGYDTWVIGKYPIEDHSVYSKVKLGKYDFITWEDGVVEIRSLTR